eukprot:TRINITY_DN44021_c0_g1_i1.p1 TRINITY_DN44021_c0_g1~~TRINITY_DN44021_c0_g1_i1.p1  ORF type:complete len:210 (+),score=58.70 TRINITY_DN44021_c0_g1_i1:74-703(+)
MVRVGAIGAARAARKRALEEGKGKRRASVVVGQERQAATEEEEEKTLSLTDILAKYDTNQSGKLEEDQVKALLTAYDRYTPAGTEPSAEELEFILKIGDQSGDGCLEAHDLRYAMKAWSVYTSRRTKMEAKLQEFDKSGTGTLSKSELEAYLTSLNDGKAVPVAEVDWVMGEADIFGDGEIRQTELVMATAAWYVHVNKNKKSKVCNIL